MLSPIHQSTNGGFRPLNPASQSQDFTARVGTGGMNGTLEIGSSSTMLQDISDHRMTRDFSGIGALSHIQAPSDDREEFKSTAHLGGKL